MKPSLGATPTDYLNNIYTLSTQYLHNIYTLCTEYLHSIYTGATPGLDNASASQDTPAPTATARAPSTPTVPAVNRSNIFMW